MWMSKMAMSGRWAAAAISAWDPFNAKAVLVPSGQYPASSPASDSANPEVSDEERNQCFHAGRSENPGGCGTYTAQGAEDTEQRDITLLVALAPCVEGDPGQSDSHDCG
jgi:hypothetical protein